MSIPGRLKGYAGRVARFALAAVKVEPATVKAFIRKPPIVHGGPRARRWPWPRRRHFDQQERRAVARLMNREIRAGAAIVYGGGEYKAYCEGFARYLGGGYAHAVNSGTNAVYVALRALDLEPGSEVIVPPMTDPGGTMPVALLNCIPIPADAAPGSFNTSVNEIRAVLSERTAAIVVAHVAGYPVDMEPILELAAQRSIPVLEDCAQALGATYRGRMAGNLATVSAFSTMFGKQHCTGAQGGVVFTRDTLLFARIRQAADRGKPYGVLGCSSHLIPSLNFNQDEISMAIGRVQLRKLPAAVNARRAFEAMVRARLQNVLGVSLNAAAPGSLSSPWFLMLRLDPSLIACDSNGFASALRDEGIDGVQAGYPFYPTDGVWYREGVSNGGSTPRRFELVNAHRASQEIVRLDVHEGLAKREARDFAAAVQKVAIHYRRQP